MRLILTIDAMNYGFQTERGQPDSNEVKIFHSFYSLPLLASLHL